MINYTRNYLTCSSLDKRRSYISMILSTYWTNVGHMLERANAPRCFGIIILSDDFVDNRPILGQYLKCISFSLSNDLTVHWYLYKPLPRKPSIFAYRVQLCPHYVIFSWGRRILTYLTVVKGHVKVSDIPSMRKCWKKYTPKLSSSWVVIFPCV